MIDIKQVVIQALEAMHVRPPPTVEMVRAPDLELPVLICLQVGSQTGRYTDAPSGRSAQIFEVSCRAETSKGAFALAESLLAGLMRTGKLNQVLGQYDYPDTPSGQRLSFFQHVVTFSIL